MPRGKAEFKTMTIIKTDGKDCTVPKGQNVKINEQAPSRPDPMKNLIGKGYERGFIKDIIDEAKVSIENKEHNMRGNASFPVMKGFGMETKGDTAAEEQLNDKMASNEDAPKGKIRDKSDDLTFDPELQLVEDGSKRDVMDGYVADHMREKPATKGFESYNEMVTKGMAVDLSINPHDVGASMGVIAKSADAVFKEVDDGLMVTKGPVMEGLKKAGSAIKDSVMSGARGVVAGARGGAEAAKEGITAGASRAKAGLESAASTVKDTAAAGLNKAKEGVAYGQKKLHKAGVQGRAYIRANPQKAVGITGGAGLGIGGAAGVGADRALSEKKCSGATVKTKGFEDDLTDKGAISEGLREAGRGVVDLAKRGVAGATGGVKAGAAKVSEGAKATYGKAKDTAKAGYEKTKAGGRAARDFAINQAETHPVRTAIVGGSAAGLGLGTAANAIEGARGAGEGKRWEGAKAGAKVTGQRLAHPIEAIKRDIERMPPTDAYLAGQSLKKKD